MSQAATRKPATSAGATDPRIESLLKGAIDMHCHSEFSALVYPDEIGVSPSLAPKFPSISIPYGCLVPQHLDGLIACGRHVACDPNSHSFLREIPQCWVTGQAAGVAAALAAGRGVPPRALDAVEIQDKLIIQGAVLRRSGEPGTAVSQ